MQLQGPRPGTPPCHRAGAAAPGQGRVWSCFLHSLGEGQLAGAPSATASAAAPPSSPAAPGCRAAPGVGRAPGPAVPLISTPASTGLRDLSGGWGRGAAQPPTARAGPGSVAAQGAPLLGGGRTLRRTWQRGRASSAEPRVLQPWDLPRGSPQPLTPSEPPAARGPRGLWWGLGGQHRGPWPEATCGAGRAEAAGVWAAGGQRWCLASGSAVGSASGWGGSPGGHLGPASQIPWLPLASAGQQLPAPPNVQPW